MKNLLKEMILPSFWLLVFIISPRSEINVNQLKKANDKKLKKQDISTLAVVNTIDKNKEAIFMVRH